MTDLLQQTPVHPVDLDQVNSTDPATAEIAHTAQFKDNNNPLPSINIRNEQGVVNTKMTETVASTVIRQDSHSPHSHGHDNNNSSNSSSFDTARSDSDSVSNCSSPGTTVSCNHEPTNEKHEDLSTTMPATMCPESSLSPNVPNDSSVDPVDRPTVPSFPTPHFDTEQQPQRRHHNHPSIDTFDNKDTTITTTTTTTTTNIDTVHCSPYSASIDPHMVSDSDSFLSSSSSSSLSDYLLIGQEQVERDDSEFDRHSERSYSRSSSPLSSSNEHYGTDMSEASQDSQTEDFQQQRPHRHATAKHSRLNRSSARQQQKQQHSPSHQSHPSRQSGTSQEISEEQFLQDRREQQQQRITHTSTLSDESLDFSSSSSSSKPQPTSRPTSPTNDKTRKRRSYKPTANETPLTSMPSEPTATETATSPLPALKIPSIKGLAKSMLEFIVASVVCVSLLSCMFALSYVSTGTNHLLGWYADQRIGQRIREGIKEREHLVQEALEKMAGEEYVKVKRRSRQQGTYSYQQHQQQQQQQKNQHHHHHHHHQHGYQNRYQQQYQQQREQRQRQEWERQQRQQQQDDEYERRRLSSAEWQELIRAASTSFLSKFTTTSGPGDRHEYRR